MTDIEINPKDKKADVFLEGEKLASLKPQEIWDLSLELRDFAISNADGFTAGSHSDIRVNDLQFTVLPLPHPEFWEMVSAGNWEPETYAIFDRFLNSKTVFLDVGAWIGSTALYGAQIAAETHAFEPDPLSFAELKANFESNSKANWFSKLNIHQKAVSNETGKINLGSKNEGGDSMSSTLFQDENQSWKVDSIDLATLLAEKNIQDKPLFIKMDIEGGEYQLIPTLKSFFESNQSSIFLALHPEFLIESIRKTKTGIFKEIRVRYAFYRKHLRLLKSLPFNRFEHTTGRPFNKSKYLMKALLIGNFPHTLMAYNS